MKWISLLFCFVLFSCSTYSTPKTSESSAGDTHNREWMLVQFDGFTKDFFMQNKIGINLTKNHSDDYTGFIGCNSIRFKAIFNESGGVRFSNFYSTMANCEKTKDFETTFDKQLLASTHYKIEGHFLTLYDEKGNEMKFVAADWD